MDKKDDLIQVYGCADKGYVKSDNNEGEYAI